MQEGLQIHHLPYMKKTPVGWQLMLRSTASMGTSEAEREEEVWSWEFFLESMQHLCLPRAGLGGTQSLWRETNTNTVSALWLPRAGIPGCVQTREL